MELRVIPDGFDSTLRVLDLGFIASFHHKPQPVGGQLN